MTAWSAERKLDAAIRAPLARFLVRSDTRVIERPGWFQVVTPSAPGSMLNEVVYSQLTAEEAEGVIDEAIETYRAIGKPTKWCVGPWTKPDDFGERLERRGFVRYDVRGMVCATALRLAPAEGVSCELVRDDTLDELLEVALRGWGMPTSQVAAERVAHREAMREPRRSFWFLARVDGACIGTAGLTMRDDYAYLIGGQVLEQARGRGVYRALVDARLAFLRERGVELAVTHAREATAAPRLERLGFETVFRSKCYVLEPPGTVG